MRMRGKLAQLYASTDQPETPFQRAQAVWDERRGAVVMAARGWRRLAYIALFGWLGTSGAFVFMALRPADVRINTIDHDGVLTSQVALVRAADFRPTDQQVAHYLHEWILDARRVSSDAGVTRRGWLRALARSLGTANQQLRGHLVGSPVERSRKGMVTLDHVNVIKVTGDTYQVDWVEKVWNPHVTTPVESSYRGLHRIRLQPPAADDIDNPIGFFVSEFHWNQVK